MQALMMMSGGEALVAARGGGSFLCRRELPFPFFFFSLSLSLSNRCASGSSSRRSSSISISISISRCSSSSPSSFPPASASARFQRRSSSTFSCSPPPPSPLPRFPSPPPSPTPPPPPPSPDPTPSLSQLGFSDPSSLPPDLLDKLSLLLQSDASHDQIQRFLASPAFLRFSSESLADVSAKLELLGPRYLLDHPELLELRTSNLRRKVDFLGTMGLHLEEIWYAKWLFNVKSETLECRLSYLKSTGLTSDDIAKIVRRHPQIFVANTKKCLERLFEFFEVQRGLERQAICKLIVKYPGIITLSTKKMMENLQLFEKLGFDPNSRQFYAAFFEICCYNTSDLRERFEWLVSQGISREQVIVMVLNKPSLLLLRVETMAEKIDYLLNVLNRDIKELLHFPIFLKMSLEKRIKPRFAVMDQLQKKGLLDSYYSLAVALGGSNEAFTKRFVAKLKVVQNNARN